MNWEDERWVKLYTRDSITWKLWCWQARFVMMSLMRKVDRAGVVDVDGHGIAGLAALLEIPADIVRVGIAQLTEPDEEGQRTVIWDGPQLVLAHFIEAQDARTSDAQRQRDSREKRRDLAKRGMLSRFVTGDDDRSTGPGPVTNCDGDAGDPDDVSQNVTNSVTRPLEVVTPRIEQERRAPLSQNVTARSRRRTPISADAETALAHFARHYHHANGQKPSHPARKLVDRLQALIDDHGLHEVRTRITRAFDSPPSWPPPPYDLAAIVQHFDRFTAARRANVGRFEPTDGLDYSSPWSSNTEQERMPWEDEP